MLIPLYLLLITAFKSEGEVSVNPIGLPKNLQLRNLYDAIVGADLLRVSLNSIVSTGATLILVVIFNTLVAYGIHKTYNKKLGGFLYSLIVITMAIPSTGLVNMLILYRQFHLTNMFGLILNQALSSIPFSVFLMVGYMRSIPKDFEEAGLIDGCSDFQSLIYILFPSIKPILATVVILSMVSSWNNLITPLLLLRDKRFYTIPIGIFSFRGTYHINYPLMFSAVILTSIPLLVFFLTQQKKFVEGLAGGIKG